MEEIVNVVHSGNPNHSNRCCTCRLVRSGWCSDKNLIASFTDMGLSVFMVVHLHEDEDGYKSEDVYNDVYNEDEEGNRTQA